VAGPDEILGYLAERLPPALLPSLLSPLGALPRTPNGKLDRAAVIAPRLDDDAEEAYLPPRTPLEEMVGAIWQEVLGIPRIGIDDDFFQRGGHSLLAVQTLSRLHEELDLKLPVRLLFEHRTLASFTTAVLDCALDEESPESRLAAESAGDKA
jgi:hypothetical protein